MLLPLMMPLMLLSLIPPLIQPLNPLQQILLSPSMFLRPLPLPHNTPVNVRRSFIAVTSPDHIRLDVAIPRSPELTLQHPDPAHSF